MQPRRSVATTTWQFADSHSTPSGGAFAASLAQLGQMKAARLEARRFLEINPGFQASAWAATQPFREKADGEHFVDGYIKAGLPR